MIKIAIFASGNGTNFEALYGHIKENKLPVTITHLICDQPKAPVIQKALDRGIPVWTHRVKEFENKMVYEQAILDQLKQDGVQMLVLAGYMRIVTNVLLDAYPKLIINIHPALLPSFPGLHGIDDAYAAGVKVTGVTVHYVDSGIDSGPIIAQEPVKILDDETVDHLEARIHEVEHELYFKSFCKVLKSKGWIDA